MQDSEDERFEKIVAAYLSEGLHTRRGLTVEEYTGLCRKAWSGCHTSETCPIKVLTDPLGSIAGKLTQDYVHWRLVDEIEAVGAPFLEIRCQAVGAVTPDLSAKSDDELPLPNDEPETPETRRYLLAVFDVLGFSGLLENKGLSEITALYSRLIAEAVTKEGMRTATIVRLSLTQMGSFYFSLPVRHAYFSDTIFLWVPLVQHFIAPFMARCADMVCEALKMGLPLRGGLAVGPAVMHSRTGTFVGAPVIEAARLEQAQDWLGVSLGASMLAADVVREFDPYLVVPYTVPFKKKKAHFCANLALDWPNRFRTRYGTDPIDAVRAVDISPPHRIYYNNAVSFARFSASPIFRGDGLHTPDYEELADAVLKARRTGTILSQQDQLILKDLSRAGAVGHSIAQFFRSIADGDDSPKVPDGLSPEFQRNLGVLSSAATTKAMLIRPPFVEAVNARLCGTRLSKEANAILKELERTGQQAKRTARFLRDMASGRELTFPRRLSKGQRPFLMQLQRWVTEGNIPSALVASIAEGCLKARVGYAALDRDALLALAAIEATIGIGPKLAVFLRGIANGENPAVPTDISEPIQSVLLHLSLASRPAGVQPPRTLEIMSVGIADPSTGVDLFSLVQTLLKVRGHATEVPDEVERAIQHFEAAAPKRAVVARRLRSLISNEPPIEPPSASPAAIRMVLMQIEALAKDNPVPVDPCLVGLAAVRSRHGGGALGDCIMFSLRAMALMTAHPEAKAFAEYLWQVANRGPAAPKPLLTEPQMVAAAEEVRCLADKEVGGISLMVTPKTTKA